MGKKGISMQYPVILLTGLFSILCSSQFGFTLHALVTFWISVLLLLISVIDQKTMLIPNKLLLALILPAVLSYFSFPALGLPSRMAGVFIISIPMYLLNVWVPNSFGGGDIKLIAVCGFFLGWKGAVLAAFIGIFTGGIYGIFLLTSGRIKRGGHFAFGPFLAFGIWTSLFYGREILEWYLEWACRRQK